MFSIEIHCYFNLCELDRIVYFLTKLCAFFKKKSVFIVFDENSERNKFFAKFHIVQYFKKSCIDKWIFENIQCVFNFEYKKKLIFFIVFDKQTSYNDFHRLIDAFRLIINEHVKCSRYIEFNVRFKKKWFKNRWCIANRDRKSYERIIFKSCKYDDNINLLIFWRFNFFDRI